MQKPCMLTQAASTNTARYVRLQAQQKIVRVPDAYVSLLRHALGIPVLAMISIFALRWGCCAPFLE